MSDNSLGAAKTKFIFTKAYEVAYAVFRISAQITKEGDFAEKLRVSATGLLVATAGEDYMAAGQSLSTMECLIKFAGDIGIVGTGNSDILLKEIYVLDVAITEAKKTPQTDKIDISEIFSNPAKKEPAIRQTAMDDPEIILPDYKTDYKNEEPINNAEQVSNNNINSILKSAIRQTAILEKIRQSGNCRLKEIQDILPETSERTIRYDLQTLLEQDLIERIGNAGPSVYYRAKQVA